LEKQDKRGSMGEEKPRADEVMDYRALAAYLKLAEGTLRHYVMMKLIPFTRIGSRVRFLKKEIDRWLLEKSSRPAGRKEGKGKPVTDRAELFPLEDKDTEI
jgi:excisionase family DNA binding protein